MAIWLRDFIISSTVLDAVNYEMARSRASLFHRLLHRQCVLQQTYRRSYAGTANWRSAEESRLPRVASPSFWMALIPRPFRRPADTAEAAQRAHRRDAGAEERRTAIFFLLLGILVGSNAINIIAVRREMLNFTRQTDAKLELLREVVQKVKNGEDVDVKRALGAGDPEQEKEWEQVMKELEEADMLLEGRNKREATRVHKAEERRLKDESRQRSTDAPDGTTEPAKATRPKFLM